MKLKLEKIPDKTLEVELPDGKIVNLTLRKHTIKEVSEFSKNFSSKKLKTYDQCIDMLDEMVIDLNRDWTDFLDPAHLLKIIQALNELQVKDVREEPEKKPESDPDTTS